MILTEKEFRQVYTETYNMICTLKKEGFDKEDIFKIIAKQMINTVWYKDLLAKS